MFEESLSQLKEKRDALKHDLVAVEDLRPGSLVARYRKCGKPNCHCAQPGAKGHGPSHSLTRQVQGKTVTRVIPSGDAVGRTQGQIKEYRRFRGLVRRFVEVSEQICQTKLKDDAAGSADGPQKKGSARRSKGRSARKPRRS